MGEDTTGFNKKIAGPERICPIACIRHHSEELTNRQGQVRATECAVCGQVVARAVWDDLLTGRLQDVP